MSAHIKTLAESGALRQFKHNDGSEGFVFAYDKEVTDRYIAALTQHTTGGVAEAVERDGERLIVWNIEDPDDYPVGTQLYAAQAETVHEGWPAMKPEDDKIKFGENVWEYLANQQTLQWTLERHAVYHRLRAARRQVLIWRVCSAFLAALNMLPLIVELLK